MHNAHDITHTKLESLIIYKNHVCVWKHLPQTWALLLLFHDFFYDQQPSFPHGIRPWMLSFGYEVPHRYSPGTDPLKAAPEFKSSFDTFEKYKHMNKLSIETKITRFIISILHSYSFNSRKAYAMFLAYTHFSHIAKYFGIQKPS